MLRIMYNKIEKDTWYHIKLEVFPEECKYNVYIDNFIFDDRFIVVIDGDEYRVFETLMETDLFRKEAVEDIVSASWQIEEEYWNERDKEKQ